APRRDAGRTLPARTRKRPHTRRRRRPVWMDRYPAWSRYAVGAGHPRDPGRCPCIHDAPVGDAARQGVRRRGHPAVPSAAARITRTNRIRSGDRSGRRRSARGRPHLRRRPATRRHDRRVPPAPVSTRQESSMTSPPDETVHVEVRGGAYADSVALLQVSKDVTGTPGVLAAQVAMATELNLELLAQMGFDIPETTPNDMVVAIRAESPEAVPTAIAAVDTALAATTRGRSESA